MQIIKDELLEVKDKYGDERRSEIDLAGGSLSIEDMIPDEQVVITISHAGYIKRTSINEYKTQNRGGVGQKASSTRNEDFLGTPLCQYQPPVHALLYPKREMLLDAGVRNSGRKPKPLRVVPFRISLILSKTTA